jgi:hypothetical protein
VIIGYESDSMTLRERRQQAWERLVLAWSIAVIPNLLVALWRERRAS